MLSTQFLNNFPNKVVFQKICKAVSVIDAVICPEWEYRYYSYNSKWSENEEFCEILNGEGDHILILFRSDGCVINGFMHEYKQPDKEIVTKNLPEIFNEFIFGEPVSSIGTTYCLWTNNNRTWQTADFEKFDDGSSVFMKIFDNNPQTYIDWAENYYENIKISFDAVQKIYNGEIITKDIVLAINPEIDDWDQLISDLEEINYPYKF